MKDEISKHAAGYDFVQLGEGLAKTLLAAAQEQVSKANQILEQTQSMADIIMTQVRAQAKQIEEMNVRYKAFGEQMLDAHRTLDGKHPANLGSMHGAGLVSQTSVSDPLGLRAVDAARRGHDLPAGIGTLPRELVTDPKRAGNPARQAGGVPLALADRFRVNPADPGANRYDQGTGSKQADRD